MYTIRVSSSILEQRLDSEFYNPDGLKAFSMLSDSGQVKQLFEIVDSNRTITNGVRGPAWENSTYKLIRLQDCQDWIVNHEKASSISFEQYEENRRCKLQQNDIVVAIGGYVGNASIVNSQCNAVIGQHSAVLPNTEIKGIDSRYVLTFLNTSIAEAIFERYVSGTVQAGINLEDLRTLPIFVPSESAQKYIGDKVRQAERLRARAKQLQYMITQIGVDNDINAILSRDNINYGFVPRKSIDTRLDPNYNNKRALDILNVIGSRGVVLNDIIISISNGHEDRNFVESGLRYVTGTELANNKLDISEAPQIADTSEVSSRAIANEKCVLFVRVGTVGNLCKVYSNDAGCVASSNIINVEFENQETAAAVCAFYQSEAGQVLLNKISFGVIQSQIGQGELLKLPVHEFILDQKSKFLELMNLMEITSRNSYNLVRCAKFLVEELIEGKISEAELVAAQQALETGDDSLDRTLLERITATGIDGDGSPLFDDIDQLYDLLAQADEAMQEA